MSAPTRYRQRYVSFETDGEYSWSDVKGYVSQLNQRLGFSPGVRLITYDRDEGRGLIRCEHMQQDRLKRELDGSDEFKVRGVSGTIKKARQKFL